MKKLMILNYQIGVDRGGEGVGEIFKKLTICDIPFFNNWLYLMKNLICGKSNKTLYIKILTNKNH